jgi:hypothetical protein
MESWISDSSPIRSLPMALPMTQVAVFEGIAFR